MVLVSLQTITFTSEEEMKELFSTDGVDLRRSDFDESSDEYENVVTRAINNATLEAYAILGKAFDDVDLANNGWVRRRATLIGCYLLSIRLGNPSQYSGQYFDALNDFQSLVDGDFFFDDLARSNSVAMVALNVSSDNRTPLAPIRTDWLSATDTVGIKWFQMYMPFSWF
jgi:hypothetical protein